MEETQNWITLFIRVHKAEILAAHKVLKGTESLCDWLAKVCIKRWPTWKNWICLISLGLKLFVGFKRSEALEWWSGLAMWNLSSTVGGSKRCFFNNTTESRFMGWEMGQLGNRLPLKHEELYLITRTILSMSWCTLLISALGKQRQTDCKGVLANQPILINEF